MGFKEFMQNEENTVPPSMSMIEPIKNAMKDVQPVRHGTLGSRMRMGRSLNPCRPMTGTPRKSMTLSKLTP